jgi:hypothetical protein
MNRRQDAVRMKVLLSRRERRGWSWAELSRRSGLPVWKLRWWQRRLEPPGPTRRPRRSFLPVQVVAASRRASPALELRTRSGVHVVVPAGFDAEHLRRVLEVLEASC